jgi:glutamyl-tRNA reductase
MTGRLWALVIDSTQHDAESRSRFRDAIENADIASRGVVLSTCQRTEAYGFGPVPDGFGGARPIVDGDAARHLIRVAAGLESGVVGEDEVLHQVRQALAATDSERLDSNVRRLFETAIAAGRRARAKRPAMTRGLGERAVEWLAARTDLRRGPFLVVGAGTMGATLAISAKRRGAEVTIASRTFARANRLAEKIGASAATLEAASDLAESSTAVAVALSGPWHELRRAPRCPIADVSTPSALDEAVRDALNGTLLDIDRLLAMTPGAGSAEAEAYGRRVDPLVDEAVNEYVDWLRDRDLRAQAAAR